MKVSVIIPLYNQGAYLHDSVGSALSQTYKNVEVVVVNDHSTDYSLRIAEQFGSKIVLVDRAANGGISAARNSGIAASSGECILPLDADDMIELDYLSKTVPLMENGIGVVSTWMRIFGCGLELTGSPTSSYPIFAPTREQILNGNTLPVCSLIRKETLIGVGGYPNDMPYGSEDWDAWASIICQGKWGVRILPEHLFLHRVHQNSFTRSPKMAAFEDTLKRIQDKHAR